MKEGKTKSFFKRLLEKLWEREDKLIFGNLFLIIGSIFIANGIDIISPIKNGWLFIGLGFILIVNAVMLLIKGEK